MVQASVYEPVNAITQRYPVSDLKLETPSDASVEAAVAAANHAIECSRELDELVVKRESLLVTYASYSLITNYGSVMICPLGFSSPSLHSATACAISSNR
jgi:hypothetical protein